MLVHLLQEKSTKFPEKILNDLIKSIDDLEEFITNISIISINNKNNDNDKLISIISNLLDFIQNNKDVNFNQNN